MNNEGPRHSQLPTSSGPSRSILRRLLSRKRVIWAAFILLAAAILIRFSTTRRNTIIDEKAAYHQAGSSSDNKEEEQSDLKKTTQVQETPPKDQTTEKVGVKKAFDEQVESNNDADDEDENPICIDERVQYGVPLHTGEYICAKHAPYKFGINHRGDLIWSDKNFPIPRTISEGQEGNYFMLQDDGKFVIYDSEGNIQWERECKEEVHPSMKCLDKFDCPYLHIHKGGTIVLNWISDDWNERNIKKIYDLFDEN